MIALLNSGDDAEQQKLLFVVGGNVKDRATLGNSLATSHKA
jgi:hypothetical protein